MCVVWQRDGAIGIRDTVGISRWLSFVDGRKRDGTNGNRLNRCGSAKDWSAPEIVFMEVIISGTSTCSCM